jgi:tetratricopeptide (TPR) repeat protein
MIKKDDLEDAATTSEREDYETTYKLFLPLAEQGDAKAQCALGFAYANGKGIEQDFDEAIKWYREATKQGDASAQYHLGWMYDTGIGVEQDDEEAVNWFRKAAEQGHSKAQCRMGLMYDTGKGLEQDDEEAVKWYRKAAEQGLAEAQNNLGEMFRDEKNYNEAVKWFRKAAEQGNESGRHNLSRMSNKAQEVAQEDLDRGRDKDGKIEDQVITKLQTLTKIKGNIFYDDIKKFAIQEIKVNVWEELDRGRAILETQDQLNYYWKSHAPMIKNQWETVFKNFKVDSFDDGFEIIDYGCGQGLACFLFLEEFYSDFKKDVSKVKLIDPSSSALQRAKMILECCSSNMQIVDINKKLDDLETKDLETDQNFWKIHLFSNILDIDNFDIFKLFNKIIKSTGDHTFLAVSHDRDFEGGTPRLEDIYSAFTEQKHDHLIINWSKKIKFNCRNRNQSPAICFLIDLKVLE